MQKRLERKIQILKILKYQSKGKRSLGRPLKGFWFAISITGLNRHNPGNDLDDDEKCYSSLDINYTVSNQTMAC
jgi:hypothetical protein